MRHTHTEMFLTLAEQQQLQSSLQVEQVSQGKKTQEDTKDIFPAPVSCCFPEPHQHSELRAKTTFTLSDHVWRQCSFCADCLCLDHEDATAALQPHINQSICLSINQSSFIFYLSPFIHRQNVTQSDWMKKKKN